MTTDPEVWGDNPGPINISQVAALIPVTQELIEDRGAMDLNALIHRHLQEWARRRQMAQTRRGRLQLKVEDTVALVRRRAHEVRYVLRHGIPEPEGCDCC